VVSQATKRRAEEFLGSSLTRLKELSFLELASWPDYPARAPFDLAVPPELNLYNFTLMKDTLPDGEIRIAIQRYRYRFLGVGEMVGDGFVIFPNGTTRPLSREDVWAIT
jgi:hypothetical protein